MQPTIVALVTKTSVAVTELWLDYSNIISRHGIWLNFKFHVLCLWISFLSVVVPDSTPMPGVPSPLQAPVTTTTAMPTSGDLTAVIPPPSIPAAPAHQMTPSQPVKVNAPSPGFVTLSLPSSKKYIFPTFNPLTPESDQCQNPRAGSQEIWHHTVWRTWLFIAYSDEKWLYYKFSLRHSYNRFLKGWENTLFELRSERVKKKCIREVVRIGSIVISYISIYNTSE